MSAAGNISFSYEGPFSSAAQTDELAIKESPSAKSGYLSWELSSVEARCDGNCHASSRETRQLHSPHSSLLVLWCMRFDRVAAVPL